MHNFLNIALEIISVYLAIALGFILRKIKKQKIDLDTISELIIYLGSPCLIFTKLAETNYELAELKTLAFAMIFIILGMALLIFLTAKFFKLKDQNVVYLSTMFMNTANIGFPVTLFTMGAIALQKAIILDLTMILLLFSLGVWIVSKKYLEWLRIPIIYAAAAGLFFSFTKIQIPALIFKPLVILAEITIPLMLISLGGKLADLQKIKNLKVPLLATFLRTFGGLLIGLIFVYLFQIKGLTREVILLYAALPAPVMAYVLAQKYHQNEILAAEIVFLSNLSALIALPVLIYFIKLLP